MRMVHAFLFSILLNQNLAWGHEAPENTAAIVQRERSLDIRLSVDLIAWLDALIPIPLAEARIEDLIPRLELAKRNLQQTHLILNEKPLPLELVQFPSPSEAWNAQIQHQKGGYRFTSIQLRADLAQEPSGHIKLQLPPELGPVIMSFSRPQTQWVQPHKAGSFDLSESTLDRLLGIFWPPRS